MAKDLTLWGAATAFEDISIDVQRIEHTAYLLSTSQMVDEMEADAFSAIGSLCQATLQKLRRFEDDFTEAHKAEKEAGR